MIRDIFNRTSNLQPARLPAWMTPLHDIAPCGPNLEYDPDYVTLMARATPRGEVQYGDFIDTEDSLNWAELERDCRHLLSRTRDISIVMLFLRCRTRQAQATGLREGLELLAALLELHPEHLHPQLTIDGEFDPAVRANALHALVDPQGLLSDIRGISIAKNSMMRLQIRDVERAHAVPRPADALPIDAVRRQLDELRHSRNGDQEDLSRAQQLTVHLQHLIADDLGDSGPDLSALTSLLVFFTASQKSTALQSLTGDSAQQEPGQSDSINVQPHSLAASLSPTTIHTDCSDAMTESDHPPAERQAALRLIQQSRAWFEQHEPSSPVAVLLRQAERMVGKRYTEVASCIPMELLQRWEKE